MTKKRTIVEKLFLAAVYRCRHQDFERLSTRETAKKLNISEAKVRQTLRHLKKIAPQLFPILSKEQAFIQDCITNKGLNHRQIALLLGNSVNTVDSIVATMKAKNVCFNRPHKTLHYKNYMDNQIVKKF